MQAKLPDVNAGIVLYRSKAVIAMTCCDYGMAVISLSSIIALLPEDYKVKISSERYNEIMSDRKSITCEFCVSPEIIMEDDKQVLTGNEIPTECILSDVKQYDLEMDGLNQILVGKTSQRVWICTKCGKLNDMDVSKIKIRRYEEPYYFGIIPYPPVQQRGVSGRNTFHSKFEVWFAIAIKEIENKIGLYRAEYAAQQEEAEKFDEDKYKD